MTYLKAFFLMKKSVGLGDDDDNPFFRSLCARTFMAKEKLHKRKISNRKKASNNAVRVDGVQKINQIVVYLPLSLLLFISPHLFNPPKPNNSIVHYLHVSISQTCLPITLPTMEKGKKAAEKFMWKKAFGIGNRKWNQTFFLLPFLRRRRMEWKSHRRKINNW